MLHTTPPCAHGFDQKYLAAPVSNLNLTCWDKTYLATSVLSRHLPGCPAAGSPSRPWPSWICFRFTLRFHSQVSHSQELPSLKDWKHTWALACKRSDCKTFARRCLVDQRLGRVHSLSGEQQRQTAPMAVPAPPRERTPLQCRWRRVGVKVLHTQTHSASSGKGGRVGD